MQMFKGNHTASSLSLMYTHRSGRCMSPIKIRMVRARRSIEVIPRRQNKGSISHALITFSLPAASSTRTKVALGKLRLFT
jgi:hypothetical protein